MRRKVTEHTIEEILDHAEGEVEDLVGEIESWKDNLEECYEALTELRDALADALYEMRALPAEVLATTVALERRVSDPGSTGWLRSKPN